MKRPETTSAPTKGGTRDTNIVPNPQRGNVPNPQRGNVPNLQRGKASTPVGIFQPGGFSMFKARGAADNLRLNAMSDGVFAIVITLMVFEIKVPQIPVGQISSQALSLALQEMLPDFARLFLSFVVLGIYWVGHNNVFQHVLKHDRLMLWLNIFFLLVVALIPFPASLLVRYGETQLAVVLYALNLLVGGVLLDLIWWYATYNRHLMCDSVGDALVHSFHQRILTGPAIYAVAILVSFFSLLLSKVLFGIAILYYLIPTIQDFLHHAQLNPQEN